LIVGWPDGLGAEAWASINPLLDWDALTCPVAKACRRTADQRKMIIAAGRTAGNSSEKYFPYKKTMRVWPA
jgi:hypothetical protein